ncbi:hypothetical protein ACHAQA_000406 [Verticillium albo-atrum]
MSRKSWIDGFRFDRDLWDPSNRFETSWLLSPWLLFACRALISVFIFTTRFYLIARHCISGSRGCAGAVDEFSFFTVLTFWGLGFYYAFAAIHTLTYALRARPLLDSFPRPLQALHALFYTTITVYPWLVTIVYWGVLYSGPWFEQPYQAYSNISQHALNSAFALFEIIIPRTAYDQMRLVHMLWLIVILAFYLALAYMTEATRGFYPYGFLDPKANGSGAVAGYILGIAAASIIIFWIVKGLVWVRQWLTERRLGMDGKFARQPAYDETELGTIGHHAKPGREREVEVDGPVDHRF